MIANSCIAGSIVDVLTTGRADISAANSENEVAERESPRSAQEKGSFVLVFLVTVVCEHRQKSADHDAMGRCRLPKRRRRQLASQPFRHKFETDHWYI